MQRTRPFPWLWVILGACLFFAIGGICLLAALASLVTGTAGKQVGLIELSGIIADEGPRSLFGGTGGARKFIDDCDRAQRDDNVKAVVIRIDSPGGAAAASQEMYQAVMRLRKSKPVICSMGDVAASGGYYVASASDKIYANGSTMTGSIGVISEFLNYQKLFEKLGLDQEVVKSGKFKDIGNPDRPMTPDERQLFQSMIMSIYSQFVDDVVAGRKSATHGKLTRAAVLKLADGRVYTGVQAKANGLIDEIGGMHEAVYEAARIAGIGGVPHLKKYSAGGLLDALSDPDSQSGAGGAVSEIADQAGWSLADGWLRRLRSEAGPGTPAMQAR